jgi:hypothetical protein
LREKRQRLWQQQRTVVCVFALLSRRHTHLPSPTATMAGRRVKDVCQLRVRACEQARATAKRTRQRHVIFLCVRRQGVLPLGFSQQKLSRGGGTRGGGTSQGRKAARQGPTSNAMDVDAAPPGTGQAHPHPGHPAPTARGGEAGPSAPALGRSAAGTAAAPPPSARPGPLPGPVIDGAGYIWDADGESRHIGSGCTVCRGSSSGTWRRRRR